MSSLLFSVTVMGTMLLLSLSSLVYAKEQNGGGDSFFRSLKEKNNNAVCKKQDLEDLLISITGKFDQQNMNLTVIEDALEAIAMSQLTPQDVDAAVAHLARQDTLEQVAAKLNETCATVETLATESTLLDVQADVQSLQTALQADLSTMELNLQGSLDNLQLDMTTVVDTTTDSNVLLQGQQNDLGQIQNGISSLSSEVLGQNTVLGDIQTSIDNLEAANAGSFGTVQTSLDTLQNELATLTDLVESIAANGCGGGNTGGGGTGGTGGSGMYTNSSYCTGE